MEFWEVRDSVDGTLASSVRRQSEAEDYAAVMNATADGWMTADLIFGRCLSTPNPPAEREPKHVCGHCRRVLMYVGPCLTCREAIEQGETDGQEHSSESA
jgi:hypothetical protein